MIDGSNGLLPPAIEYFPEWERERVRVQETRYQIAMEDVDAASEDYFRQYVSDDRLRRWGPPDTARNALAAIGHAVSTPGHYGRSPMLIGPAAHEAAELTEDLWPRLQHGEFLTYTCGSVAVYVEPDSATGAAKFHVVPSHRLWASHAPDDPTEPVVMRRLRVRRFEGGSAYAWDIWDVRDPLAPVWGIFRAERNGAIGEDLTYRAIGVDSLSGDAYPWRDTAGRPFLPWSIHRSWDVGDLWNWQRGRSVARGTLQAMMLYSACNRAALNATGKVALIFNARPMSATLRGTDDGVSTMTLDAEPGDLVYHSPLESGVQPSVSEIGEVGTLPALQSYAQAYSAQLAADMGITPTDAVRAGANPMSGTAIHLTNETKRLEQRRRGPLCRKADLATIRHACWISGVDPAGLGIVYYEIGKGPEEERADREDQEWALKNGLLSPSDVMMIRNPGMSREDALIELARVQREAGAQSPAVEAAALALDDLAERAPSDVAAEIRRIAAALEGSPEDLGGVDSSAEDHGSAPMDAPSLAAAPDVAAAPDAVAAPSETVAAVEVALNGAQAEFLVSVVSAVGKGEIPKTSGIAAIRIALPMVPEDLILAMFADVVEGANAEPAP